MRGRQCNTIYIFFGGRWGGTNNNNNNHAPLKWLGVIIK